VAAVHLEFFPDGIEGIARAKYELVQSLPPDGLAILNADDPRVADFANGLSDRAILYGQSETAKVRANNINEIGAQGIHFTVTHEGQSAEVALKLLGRHNVSNALAAIATGLASGMTLHDCAAAIGTLEATDKRGVVLNWNGATLINDCYNSNPIALDAMVDALLAIPVTAPGRHIVIAGEMLELGPESEALHHACGLRMQQRGVDVVVGVRGLASALARAANGTFLETPEQAGQWLLDNIRPGDAVLLKASRGVKLERALDVLKPLKNS
jgi:UDP-N-acetylmuramoyl-tripeptide--D-alanyl-D-alanine ligase